MKQGPKRRSVPERFWEKVKIGGPEECWEWQAYVNPVNGYGCFDGKSNTHRVAFKLSGGDCSQFVLHKCDNKICCNPNHLFAGSQLDNMRDANMKGRHGRTKLTFDQVRYIRRSRPGRTLKSLSKELGVTIGTVHHAEKGISWKHVI